MAGPQDTFRQSYEPNFGALSSLDPIAETAVFQVTEKIMNRLVRPGLDGRVIEDLATSWEANEIGTRWIFRLREGVTFHDGTSFGAEDVVYSLRRVLDQEPESAARLAVNSVYEIEALDSMTVEINLDGPTLDLPWQMTNHRLRIIPDGSGDLIGKTGIGTGPLQGRDI